MTKFKCTENSRDFVEVLRDKEGRLALTVGDNHSASVAFIATSDAPALALAILEAAGVEPDREPLECQVSLGTIVADLQDTIRHGEALAAEAEAQAKLEAEALELFKASGAYGSDRILLKFSDLDDHIQKAWLAVARRARELNKDENNA